MKFEVKFVSVRLPVNFEQEQIGIDRLDWVRQKLGIGIPSFIVKGVIPPLRENSVVAIFTEEAARKSGMFQGRNTVYVEVPPEFLNQYTHRKVSVGTNRQTGEIGWVRVKLEINTAEIVNAWKAARYPLKWGFNKEEINQ